MCGSNQRARSAAICGFAASRASVKVTVCMTAGIFYEYHKAYQEEWRPLKLESENKKLRREISPETCRIFA